MMKSNASTTTMKTSSASFFFDSALQNGLEDWAITTRDPVVYGGNSPYEVFLSRFIITCFLLLLFIVLLLYFTNRDKPTRRELFNEVDSNRGAADTTRVTISDNDSTNSSISHGRIEPHHAVAEKPPDYSTVVLNDLINPTKPAFPVVKKDNETPPPEYGKENAFFK
ncbi:hypothetical protein AVEN_259836-1 [Araneus ventricosus]|uniref:Uncharacterized protein n=1 Tax=Araneus ventricosus TaxID=182803 RepID=A0A4Y2I613_ARAVE|nr:hypothetical protein AVEN_259836-1 [Araneus ventricosus]